jgi:hypothetical protein
MAEVFRKIYLERGEVIYQDSRSMYMELLSDFMNMLQADNPKFNRMYFINFIKYGRCKLPKSPSGEAQA